MLVQKFKLQSIIAVYIHFFVCIIHKNIYVNCFSMLTIKSIVIILVLFIVNRLLSFNIKLYAKAKQYTKSVY